VDTLFSPRGGCVRVEGPCIVANAPAATCTPEFGRGVAAHWLPNWRNPSQYPDSKASRVDWAWQFLRRNPEYQKLWSEHVGPRYDKAHVESSFQRTAGGAREDLDGRHRVRLMMHGGPHPDQAIFRKRFGVITIPQDPSESIATVRFEAQSVRYARPPLCRPPADLQDHQVLVCLDLEWPIEAQLKNVKRLLAQELKNQKLNKAAFRFRFRADKYRRYLQLLDARIAGASARQIAKIVYGDSLGSEDAKKRVRQDRKVAEALRDNPWRIVAGGE
jgi:hypothetical protein